MCSDSLGWHAQLLAYTAAVRHAYSHVKSHVAFADIGMLIRTSGNELLECFDVFYRNILGYHYASYLSKQR